MQEHLDMILNKHQNCDDPEYLETRKAIAKFANKFHGMETCGRIQS